MGNNSIKVWGIETGEIRRVDVKERILVSSVDGTMLLTSSDEDGVRRVWDLNLEKCPPLQQRILLLGTFNLDLFTISPDKRLVAGGRFTKGKVVVWETESGAVVSELEICEWMTAFKFSSNGDRLLVGSEETVYLLELTTFNKGGPRKLDLRGYSYPSSGSHGWFLSCSMDNKYVLSGDSDGSIYVRNNNGVPQFVLGRAHKYGGNISIYQFLANFGSSSPSRTLDGFN